MTGSSIAVNTTDRELVYTRIFDAPRDLVFTAWTDPNHVAQWWGPQGFTTTIHEMDVRPGGIWRLTMRGPDGTDYRNRIVFLEVVKPARLVYKHDPEPGSEPVTFETTVTFDDEGAKTKLTMRQLFPSAAALQHVVSKYGAIEGAKQTLGRLAEHLPGMTADLVLTRIFDAPRALVFQAWTDVERLKRWWGPKNFTNPVCEIDPRPGGAIRIHMRAPDGAVYPMTGVFQEVAPPERLVFKSAALDAKGDPLFEILNTVAFAEHGGETKLTLSAKVITATAEAPRYLAGMETGWSQSLDRLSEEVKASEFSISREFDAPRELVWKALTEPDRLTQWWGPKGLTMLTAKLDLHPGGVFLYSMRSPDGREMWGKWVYREIVPPERLVAVTSFTDEAGNLLRHPMSPTWPLEVLNTLSLSEHNGKTTLTIAGGTVNATAEERATFGANHGSMKQGFTGTLNQLADYLAKD